MTAKPKKKRAKASKGTTILLVDDHAMFRKGLRVLLESEDGLHVIGEAGDGKTAVRLARELTPDVVVMDVSMPEFSGIEATRTILAETTGARVVALSVHGGRLFVEDMLKAGALGYILKESAPEELIQGIATVARGDVYLSPAVAQVVVTRLRNGDDRASAGPPVGDFAPRDREFLRLVKEGRSAEEIVRIMRIKPDTEASRRRRIMAEIQVTSDAQLVAFAEDWVDQREMASEKANPKRVVGVLQTKLHAPDLGATLVARPRLMAVLSENMRRPVTLVSAPAGYGKSTLVAQWIAGLNIKSSWLSLGVEESDVRTFMEYFVAAVQRVFPEACKGIRTLLQARQFPPISVLSDTLANDMDALREPLILALDDYHLIRGSEVHELVDNLLRYPPRTLHLVIVTRRDPPLSLSTLRVRRILTEIGQDDLRFSHAESRAIIEQSVHAQLSDDALEVLNTQMEGWVVGLHLFCLALGNRDDPDRLLRELKGGIQQANEFLTDEVLSRQPKSIQELLLKTSVLDQFCAPLCVAIVSESTVVGRREIDGEGFIQTLQRSNLFTIALDSHGEWFRYHHLFQQLLRNQLARSNHASDVAAIHLSASRWFESEGFIEEAVRHAMEADDSDRAAEIVERYSRAEFSADRWINVERWLAMLPDETREQRPTLLLNEASVCYCRFQLEKIPAIIERVEALWVDEPDDAGLRGELAYFKGTIEYWSGLGESSRRHLEEGQRLTGHLRYVNAELALTLGLARSMCGESDLAVQSLEESIRNLPRSEVYIHSRMIGGLVFIDLLCGDLHRARVDGEQMRSLARDNQMANTEAWATYLKGCAHLHALELDAAEACFAFTFENRYVIETQAAVDAMMGLALARQLAGKEDEATQALDQLESFTAEVGQRQFQSVVEACQARISLLRGDLADAVERSRFIADQPSPAGLFIWLEVPVLTQARVKLASGSEVRLAEAVGSLRQIKEMSEGLYYKGQALEATVLLALALDKQGKSAEADLCLGEALAAAEAGGWIRSFVEAGPAMIKLLGRVPKGGVGAEFARTVLGEVRKAWPAPSEPAAKLMTNQQLIDPLTNRELDVLELLVERLQYKELAERLNVSNQTIKTHLKHIYQKLGVNGRQAAVEKAVELGLV